MSDARAEFGERWIPGTRHGMTPKDVGQLRATGSTVIAGLVPAIQPSTRSFDRLGTNTGQRGIKVAPMRVLPLDQVDLPGARPFLHGLLSLNGLADARKLLEPHELMHSIFPSEAGPLSSPVLLKAEDETAGDADVQRPSGFAGEDVNPVAAHGAPLNWRTEYAARWIAGTSPAMTSAGREAIP